MAMFLAEISFLFALGLFAAGLVLWHHGRQPGAGLLRVAGGVLGAGAVLSALCTLYFTAAYQSRGDFDRAYPHMMGAGMGPGMMGPHMGPGRMGPGMMRRRHMRPGMPGAQPQTPPPPEPPAAAEKPE